MRFLLRMRWSSILRTAASCRATGNPPCGRTAGQMSAEPPKADMFRSISLAPTVPASPAAFAATAVVRTTAGSGHGTKTAVLIPYGGVRPAENAKAPVSRTRSSKSCVLRLWGWSHLTRWLSVSRSPAFTSWLHSSFPSASLTVTSLKRDGKTNGRCPGTQSSASSICGK